MLTATCTVMSCAWLSAAVQAPLCKKTLSLSTVYNDRQGETNHMHIIQPRATQNKTDFKERSNSPKTANNRQLGCLTQKNLKPTEQHTGEANQTIVRRNILRRCFTQSCKLRCHGCNFVCCRKVSDWGQCAAFTPAHDAALLTAWLTFAC